MIILEYINSLIDFCTKVISTYGIIFGFLLILLESFLPILPLGFFVALNVNAFGGLVGIILSWVATCLGCFISYHIFSFLSLKYLDKLFSKKTYVKINRAISKFQKISFSNLVLVIALPFTPAFLINIICGIVRINKQKFLLAILIGKVFTIIFWGYIGKSLIESVTDINTIIIISVMLLSAYLISKVVNKKMNLD